MSASRPSRPFACAARTSSAPWTPSEKPMTTRTCSSGLLEKGALSLGPSSEGAKAKKPRGTAESVSRIDRKPTPSNPGAVHDGNGSTDALRAQPFQHVVQHPKHLFVREAAASEKDQSGAR